MEKHQNIKKKVWKFCDKIQVWIKSNPNLWVIEHREFKGNRTEVQAVKLIPELEMNRGNRMEMTTYCKIAKCAFYYPGFLYNHL